MLRHSTTGLNSGREGERERERGRVRERERGDKQGTECCSLEPVDFSSFEVLGGNCY